MNQGDYIYTPRFCNVRISEVLSQEAAQDAGFTEPTHYEDGTYKILGKSIGYNRMIFAAVKKQNKFKVLSYIYLDSRNSFEIEPAGSDEYSFHKLCDDYVFYVDVFDTYKEAQAFCEDCHCEERREKEV